MIGLPKLAPKQKLFADEYLVDLNATRAYKVTHPRVKRDETARANGSRMLTNANVAAYISERQKARELRTEITQDMVIKELAAVGFARGTDYSNIDTDGLVRLTPTDNLTDNQKAAVTSIKTTQTGVEIKLADKVKALELLGKHLGMFSGAAPEKGTDTTIHITVSPAAIEDSEEDE